jgi:cytochrome P450
MPEREQRSIRNYTIAMSPSNTHRWIDLFDPSSPQHVKDPFTFFARLQEAHPVYWNGRCSFWVLTRYHDVQDALQSPDIFSSVTILELEERGKSMPLGTRACFDICYRFWNTAVQAADASQHTRHRATMAKIFTSGLIEEIQAAISQHVERPAG